MTQRIRALSQSWSDDQAADLIQQGVQFLDGQAVFLDAHHIQVTSDEGSPTELEADAIIIASGSVPIFPPNLKPDGKRIIAPRFAGKLECLPRSLIMVGGGVTGTEFAYAFNRLGVDVNWIVAEGGDELPGTDRTLTLGPVDGSVEKEYYWVTDKPTTGRSFVNWGGTSRRQMNEWVITDALYVLKAAGRW